MSAFTISKSDCLSGGAKRRFFAARQSFVSQVLRRKSPLLFASTLLFIIFQVATASATVISTTTFHISAPSGGDCAAIGTWDSATSTCTLNTDVTVNGADGIHIDSDGVTLDGGGHTLTGSNTSNTNGVYGSGRTGVTIKNLTVQQFSYGISLANNGSGTVSGNTANSNSWAGIYIDGSGNTLSGNTTNSDNQQGIIVNDPNGSGNTVSGNAASSNTDGIAIWGASNTVSGNTVSGNGDGIYLNWNGSGNTVSGNTANNNTYGIFLDLSNSNTVSGNTTSSNRLSGIAVNGAKSNTISGNTVSSNNWHGIFLGQTSISDSCNTILTGNAIRSNNIDGIGISSYCASSDSVHFNDIFANNSNGIDSSDSSVDATNNYWGSKHGPKPYGFGNGFNGASVIPWSGIPFTQAGAAYQASLGMRDYCAICGDPINTATGAYVYQHSDVKVPTKGIPLEFERTYNSNDASDGDLGFGWSYNWQISVNPEANGNVVILRGDGSQDLFTKNPDGSYSPPSLGVHDTLSRNTDGTYKLVTKDQTTYSFNPANLLASVTAENGQVTTLTYNANQQLVTITEPTGRTIGITHDSSTGRITQITDPNGKSISFTYSPAGDLTSVTDQDGGVTKFAYDSYHHITNVTDANGHASANNTYDSSGRVISQTDADSKLITFTYDTTNLITTMTRQMDPGDSSKDETTTFYYDPQYQLIKETDPYGKSTTYTYDAAGDRGTVTDRRGVITKQLYDPSGNITDIYKAYGLPEQEHTSYTYNARNHPLSKIDARGYTTTYTYDSSGSFLTQVAYPQVTNYNGTLSNFTETFTYNPDGTAASFTDKNGNITTYGYDPNGNLSAENKNTNRSAQDQMTLSYVYDAMGRKTSATDGNGHTATFAYDNLGNLTSETKQVTDPGTGQLVNVTTATQYDAVGNKIKVTDADGNTTSYSYTPMNRLDTATDALLNTIQYTYDAAGNKTGTKDRNGNWTHFTYDLNNRMVSSTDPENNVTTYTYDEEGNQTSVKDPLGNTTTKTYDGISRVAASTVPDVGGAVRTTSYTYDAADNLLITTDPLNHTTTNVYDELGRLKSVTDPVGNVSYTAYDGLGNKVKTKDPKGNETSFAFSPNNWLTTVSDPAGGVTSYAYDKNGNRTQQTGANGHVTDYSYDELNRPNEERVDAGGGNFLLDRSYTYDKTGHLLTDKTADGTFTNTYDGVYNLTGVTDRQNNTYSYTYDANQNQLSAKDNGAGKTVSFTYSPRSELASSSDAVGTNENFTYDGAGNLLGRSDTVSGQNFTTSYAYTPRDQLSSVSKGTDTTSYTFDPAGNLQAKSYANGVHANFSYDADSRLTGVQAVKGTTTLQSYSQAYDKNSNVTSLTEPAGTDSFTYDALNRETSENLAAYGQETYAYDPAGNRTAKTQPAGTGGPVLALSMTKVYWASTQDYQNRLLSIDYSVKDNGPGTAYASQITGATATNDVYLSTTVPVSLGDIAQGASAPATLKYYIPPGVGSFSSTVYADCKDQSGSVYAFPTDRTTYSYNQANQLTSSYDQQGVTTGYTYNAAGALTQKASPSATTSYGYNGLEKLTQVTTPASTIGYAYDALGRRISRTDGGSTINYSLNGKSDLTDYETNGSGTLTGSYQRGADGLISQTDYTGQSPVTTYDLYDPHGDTAATTDQNGNVTSTYRYDSFGNAIGANNLADAYTGKWQRDMDNSTGLIQMGGREYDPAPGRFTAPDPLKGDATNPQQRNRYPYVGSNPLSRYDLDGLSWYGDAWDWTKKKASEEKSNFVIFSQEYLNAESKGIQFPHPLSDTEFAKLLRDRGIELGLAIGMGVPGDEYTPEMESFFGGSKPIDEFGNEVCPDAVNELEEHAYGNTPEGRPFTKHYATETGPGRNIPVSLVDQIIDNIQGTAGENGTTIYYDSENDLTVVTGDGQSIVSVHRGAP